MRYFEGQKLYYWYPGLGKDPVLVVFKKADAEDSQKIEVVSADGNVYLVSSLSLHTEDEMKLLGAVTDI